ncbi:LytR C-terminal domain-containing protein [Phycicoccus sp. MAQZ13P-2]|uniref:LytR C-terminal domain-containing protein n=1 Tax=Phycicoccus mangrovi TaxID=2840470 RepID=UPI001C001B5F|nr:LytR C-terminal domain-containing protein [Phycicoccus mangrovi]MBT9256753.1 LytR C-terminal domain-containing protein [Phycicoccus mangrovi]MBT9274683.1 LytR C-terminal domain-containing protein [Phycicoccus mangrovi]
MSEYADEAPVSVEARRRRRRAVVVIGVVLLGLFFAFWYALSYYRADEQARASRPAAPTCRPYDPDARVPGQVTVDVYNATNRSNLASRTAQQLEKQGFVVGKVGNDTSERKTPAVAEVRYGPAGRPDARLLLTVLPKGTKAVNDKRTDGSVEIALGTKFTNLKPYVAPTDQLPMCPEPTTS